jgi:hypothetical protein
MKVAIYLLEFLSRTVIYTYSHAGSHDNFMFHYFVFLSHSGNLQ